MSAALESLQNLIKEADSRFNEKIHACAAGHPTNLNVYCDRTYNLRHQIAHNPQLTTDPHFMEMLASIETALAPEYTAQGDVSNALTSLLGGLLKTILREVITQSSDSMRKIMVEMVWHWHQDKLREILDFTLERQYPKSQISRPATAAANEDRPAVAVPTISAEELDRQQTQKAVVRSDAHDETFIAHKLSLYKRRNLCAARDPKVVMSKDAQDRQRRVAEVRRLHTEACHGPAGPPPLLHAPSEAPHFSKPRSLLIERGIALTSRDASDTTIADAEMKIIAHAAWRVQQEHHRLEARDAVSILAFNQSRLSEESSRRLESSANALQTGTTCHTHLTNAARMRQRQRDSVVEPPQSFSPFEQLDFSSHPKDETATTRHGLPPPSRGALPALEVVLAADCVVTPPTVRIDVPIVQQLHDIGSAATHPISVARLRQLALVHRVRTSFAQSGAKGSHCPYRAALRAVVEPTDCSIDDCLRHLPLSQDFLPANPYVSTASKKGRKK